MHPLHGHQAPVRGRSLRAGAVAFALAVIVAAPGDEVTQFGWNAGHAGFGAEARPCSGDLPAVADPPSAAEVHIYPSGDRLPSNLLRLYLVFDRPMRPGDSHAHLQLVDDRGRTVHRAFLELDDELWDPTGRRLTVLFDPGRIKRGLRSNVEDGPPLEPGRRYQVVVDAGWRDADGHPLGRAVSKAFVATAPDRASPAVGTWHIDPPIAGSRLSLVVDFGEPLDRALVATAITVVAEDGSAIGGEADATPGEERWIFTPHHAWKPGTYALRVASRLEDVAGNNLQRVFDVDLQGAATGPAVPPVVERRFVVPAGT